MEEKILATVIFLMEEDDMVWLAEKTRKINVGCINGYGGKFDHVEDKDLIACSVRETKQECGVDISQANFEKVAVIDFHNMGEDGNVMVWEVHFYFVRNFAGIPMEILKDGGMINPNKYDKNNLPLEKMALADQEFVPLLMSGKKLIATYYYGPYQKELIKEGWYKIVDSLPE